MRARSLFFFTATGTKIYANRFLHYFPFRGFPSAKDAANFDLIALRALSLSEIISTLTPT
jgi:hypothetical protein